MVPKRIPPKIENAIGDHAIAIDGERQLCIGKSDTLANKNLRIPRPSGLYKKIKEVKPDILIGEGFFQWTPFALKYCFLHNKPLLVGYERTKWTERNCPKWRKLYRQIIDKFVSGYLCNGSLTKEYLIDEMGIKRNKIYTGTMSADSVGLAKAVEAMTTEERNLFKKKLGLSYKGVTYIYTGYLIPRKGVKYLLQAWTIHIQKYPNDHLLLVGGGELYQELLQTYQKNHSILFIGTVNYDDIYKYYAVADVFIIPTIEDNWSLVVPEAMACGLPIACSIYNGCYPELCKEGENGVLFDPFEETSICKTLEIFHHVNLKAYGKRSIEIEKNYDSEKVAQTIYNACLEIYRQKRNC